MTENETTEYKKTLSQLKDGIISISAILNKHGKGDLWFGIRDDGEPLGVDTGEKTVRDISQAIAAHVEPKIYPIITIEELKTKRCVRVRFEGAEMPYYAYGRAYMRVADEDRQLSAKELERLILKKNAEGSTWDSRPCGAALTDLSQNKIKAFVKQARLTWDSAANALEKLGVLRNDRLLNAAPLFFGKKPLIQLRCAVFASTTRSTILDQHDFQGNILTLIEQAQAYILKNIHIGMRLEGLYRVDVPEIAVAALREAIINAFCHRDYQDSEEVRVAIFKDRVDIHNPGTLFGGLTLRQLRTGNISRRRNPLIAEMLRRVQMVEGWGRGMPLILEQEPGVQFREVAGVFLASFARPSFKGVEALLSPALPEILPEKIDEPRPGDVVSVRRHHERTRKELCRLLSERPESTIAEMAAHLALHPRTVERHLAQLRTAGRIRRIGTARKGRWEVV